MSRVSEAVRDEIEENLFLHLGSLDPGTAGKLLDDYSHLIKIPDVIPYPDEAEVVAARQFIRHATGRLVLISYASHFPEVEQAAVYFSAIESPLRVRANSAVLKRDD